MGSPTHEQTEHQRVARRLGQAQANGHHTKLFQQQGACQPLQPSPALCALSHHARPALHLTLAIAWLTHGCTQSCSKPVRTYALILPPSTPHVSHPSQEPQRSGSNAYHLQWGLSSCHACRLQAPESAKMQGAGRSPPQRLTACVHARGTWRQRLHVRWLPAASPACPGHERSRR